MGSGACIRRSGRARARSRPAQRYVSAQVGEGDVTLGDTSVPELMQTDAFELMVHDPELPRARGKPGLQGACRPAAGHGGADVQPARRSALLRRNPKAFAGVAQAAQNASALAPQGAPGQRGADERRRRPSGGDAGARFAAGGARRDRSRIRRPSRASRPTPTRSSNAASKAAANASMASNAAAFQQLASDNRR